MKINSLQVNQVAAIPDWTGEKSKVRTADIPQGGEAAAIRTSSLPAGPSAGSELPSLKGIVMGINYMKEQLDAILTDYPPFFPPGSPQRPDLIKKIEWFVDEIRKSSTDEDLKKLVPEKKLSQDAGDEEIDGALKKLFQVRDVLAQKASLATDPVKPGTLMDIRM